MASRWNCECERANVGGDPCVGCGAVSPFAPWVRKHVATQPPASPIAPSDFGRELTDANDLIAALTAERDELKELAASRLKLMARYAKENERIIGQNVDLCNAIERLTSRPRASRRVPA